MNEKMIFNGVVGAMLLFSSMVAFTGDDTAPPPRNPPVAALNEGATAITPGEGSSTDAAPYEGSGLTEALNETARLDVRR